MLEISLFGMLHALALGIWMVLELLWPYWLIPIMAFTIRKMIKR